MFDVFYSGIKPNLFAHEQPAHTIEHAKQLSRTRYFWWITYLSDYSGFDFLFEPVPWESQYTHAWPSQWHEYSGTFLVPKRSQDIQYRFHTKIIPNRAVEQNYIKLQKDIDFDWSWHPHPFDPPYRYVFGNQWYPANRMPTVEYAVAGATETKYVFTPRAELRANTADPAWHTTIQCEFNYSWRPDPGDPPFIYVFGNQWWSAEKQPTVQYCVPGASEKKYMLYPRAELPVDMTNWSVPNAVDLESFDFSWRPDPGDPPFIYQFGTQHQRTGGPQYLVAGATEIKYVDQIRIRTDRVATAIYEIDHLDGHAGQIENTTRTVRYFDNYLDTLRRLIKSIPEEHEFIWICSSICDYTNFDFTWHPEQWQASMLHVFPSSGEKFGDTFFMHVPTFRYRAERLELLDWYDINYMNINVPRRPVPVIQHTNDTQVAAVKEIDFAGPLAIFTTKELTESTEIPAVPLWREKTKTIVPLSKGATTVIVPKVAIPYIQTQLYDYANIDRRQRHLINDAPLDIVFIDNGEPIAEINWLQLPHVSDQNKIHRSSGVNGRVAAYRAAAELSTTPWFFAVFAKLETNPNFDWTWQPDRLQEPKHYIFHAYNPVNELTYGHQAIIAYNKKLVLENTAGGLDFTLDQAHEVVPLMSGTANYHYDAWTCWRTAFRETIKLRHSLPDIENEYRLRAWLERDNTKDKWSQKGAEDAVEYYEAVAGDFAELRKSYDWNWLASYALIKRNLVANQ